MKKAIVSVLALMSFNFAYADVQVELLRCTQKDHRPGAPAYVVSVIPTHLPSIPSTFLLTKVPVNPNATQVSAEIPMPLEYGDVLVVTKNSGRSGYAHLYSNGDTTVIDINLFQMRETGINTDGPLTDYYCQHQL